MPPFPPLSPFTDHQAAAPLEGAHGMRSRFLPVDQLDDETFAPRIVQVAGAMPGLTVADLMAVGFSPPAEMGMWQYDFSDPTGPQVTQRGTCEGGAGSGGVRRGAVGTHAVRERSRLFPHSKRRWIRRLSDSCVLYSSSLKFAGRDWAGRGGGTSLV